MTKKITQLQSNAVTKMYLEGTKIKDISRATGLSPDQIYRCRKRLRLPRRKRHHSIEEKEAIITETLASQGNLTQEEIAKKHSITRDTLQKWLRKKGITKEIRKAIGRPRSRWEHHIYHCYGVTTEEYLLRN